MGYDHGCLVCGSAMQCTCEGKGVPNYERVRCQYCGGSGSLPEQGEEGYTGREERCFNCNGSGET